MADDLHNGKDDHLSVPIAHDVEVHVRKDEVNHECKPRDKYMVCIPSEVSSVDDKMVRFKQIMPFKFESMDEYPSEEEVVPGEGEPPTEEEAKTMPLSELRKRLPRKENY